MAEPEGARTRGLVLVVAGSDSGGGAGIQADIKTVMALGGHAMTAITALTAQNTLGVNAIEEVPPEFVARQMTTVLSDLGADCIKIGMLRTSAVIAAVHAVLAREAAGIPVVVDTVMTAKGGTALLAGTATRTLVELLFPGAALITPNLPEALALTGLKATTPGEMEPVARALSTLTRGAVLLKGGHLPGDTVVDLLLEGGRMEAFSSPRLATPHTHGTGCTLASAVATGLAQGLTLREAVARARAYVREAIRTAPGLGHGHGPLNHGHTVRPFYV